MISERRKGEREREDGEVEERIRRRVIGEKRKKRKESCRAREEKER